MVYRKVDRAEKVKAVLAVMGGGRASVAARESGMSRGTLYRLVSQARALIKKSFCTSFNAEGRENARLRGCINSLRREAASIRHKIDKYEAELLEANKKIEIFRQLGRPARCRSCGCEKIYRNGSYQISHSNFCRSLEKQKNGKIEVKHFICAACDESMYVVDPVHNIFRIESQHGKDRSIVHQRGAKAASLLCRKGQKTA